MITRLLYKTTRFNTGNIRHKSSVFKVMLADSPGRQMLGLMYRKQLGKREGMLFVFKKDGRYDIWMMNMRFSIDIIWLDKNGKVLKVAQNAKPCTSFLTCEPHRSPDNARYVVELNAGTSKKEGIKTGSSFIL